MPENSFDSANFHDSPETNYEDPIDEEVMNFSVGDRLDVHDSFGRWCEAEVLKIDRQRKRIYVGYIYWDSKFDEWISNLEERVSPLHTHTYHEGGILKFGQRIETKDSYGKWLESFIIDESKDEVKVHYKNYHPNFDEWIPRNSGRFRPYGRFKSIVRKKPEMKQWKVPVLSNNHRFRSVKEIGHEDHSSDDSESEDHYQLNQRMKQSTELAEGRKRRIAKLSQEYRNYVQALTDRGMSLFPVEGDGNCLFRAVSHQIYGDEKYHNILRQKCIDYMQSESSFFSQYVEGGEESFGLYLEAKRHSGCWGDDPEIEALSEIYNRSVEIWSYDPILGAKALKTFHEGSYLRVGPHPIASNSSTSDPISNPCSGVIRLSYYGGGHYDSIMDTNFNNQVIKKPPGEIEDRIISYSKQKQISGSLDPEEIAKSLTDAQATEKEMTDLIIQESRKSQLENATNDIETCLLQQLELEYLADSKVIAKNEDKDAKNLQLEEAKLHDSEIMNNEKESDEDFVEEALLNSVAKESKLEAENKILDFAKKESQKDNQLENEVHEDQDLKQALLESLKGQNSNPYSANDPFNSNLSEEQQIQLAIAESMNDKNPIGFEFGFGEEDEELARAIEESFKK